MEDILDKKLQSFVIEMVKMGTVKGFQYFTMYVRGREELMISVLNQPLEFEYDDSNPGSPLSSSGGFSTATSATASFNSANLPYDKRSLMLSQRTQRQLSGYDSIGVGLPPASPSEHETMETDENSTLFLLASYSRYKCPYVWVRSNHRRLVKVHSSQEEERDSPLRLKCTNNWNKSDIKPWDVIAELVKLNTYPPPTNPFEVDFGYFESVPKQELLVSTAAMMNLLQKVILYTPDDKYYTAKVMEDLERLTKLHYRQLAELVRDDRCPLAQRLVPVSPRQHTETNQTRRHRTSSSGSRYPPEAYQAYG